MRDSAPLRTLHIIESVAASRGGTASAACMLAAAEAAQGCISCVAFTSKPSEEYADAYNVARAAGVNFRSFPRRRPEGRFVSWRLLRWLSRVAAQHDVVLVHNVWTFPGLLAPMLLSWRRARYFVVPHTSLADADMRKHQLLKRLLMPIVRRNLRGAAGIIAGSELEADQSSQFRNQSSWRVQPWPVPCLSRSTTAQPVTRRSSRGLRNTGSRLRVGFMGRLHPVKNLELLVRAVSLPSMSAASVWIAGPAEDTAYAERVRNLAAELGLNGRSRISPALIGEAKSEFFRSVDVLCLVSQYENFGIVALEALSFGVPVVVSPNVGIVNYGLPGIIVLSREDPRLLASSILDASRYTDPHKREAMQTAARAFTPRHIKLTYLEPAP